MDIYWVVIYLRNSSLVRVNMHRGRFLTIEVGGYGMLYDYFTYSNQKNDVSSS